jgi:hypothetical protein
MLGSGVSGRARACGLDRSGRGGKGGKGDEGERTKEEWREGGARLRVDKRARLVGALFDQRAVECGPDARGSVLETAVAEEIERVVDSLDVMERGGTNKRLESASSDQACGIRLPPSRPTSRCGCCGAAVLGLGRAPTTYHVATLIPVWHSPTSPRPPRPPRPPSSCSFDPVQTSTGGDLGIENF